MAFAGDPVYIGLAAQGRRPKPKPRIQAAATSTRLRRMITAKNFWFWFGGIWFAVGVVFLAVAMAIGVNGARLDARFAAQGRTVEGVVLGKEIVSSSSSSSSSSSPSYRVTFRFTGERGETLRGTADVEAEAWDALIERGPIAVTYLPERPQAYRVAGQRQTERVLSLVFGGVGAALAIVGGFVLFTALRNRRRERGLEREGVLTAAVVTALAPGNIRVNGVPQWKLRYRFSDSQGRTHEGSRTLSAEEAQHWQPGTTGRVRYDARNPRSHVWIGKS
jgi:hypothetical protein